MRITNHDELRARWQTGPGPVPAAPVADAPVPAHANAVGPSAPRHRRRSGQRSRQARTERRQATRSASRRDVITGMTAAAPTGECVVSELQYPLDLRGAAMAHASSTSEDVAAREGRPNRRASAAENLAATTDDESYHGSTSELPPATSHRYVKWDFSGVPDPVMFQRFLDATDYWFGYSDNSSVGSYDPAWECFVVLANDEANAANAMETGDGEVPPGPGAGPHQGGTKRASPLTAEGSRHQCIAGPGMQARSQTRGGVLRGAATSRLHRRGSLRARRLRARVGQTSSRAHQR
jgi:hypothetical protein